MDSRDKEASQSLNFKVMKSSDKDNKPTIVSRGPRISQTSVFLAKDLEEPRKNELQWLINYPNCIPKSR